MSLCIWGCELFEKKILRLFPGPTESVPLKGLYLQEDNHLKGSPEQPHVYANFLSSLDGRIALEDERGVPFLPKSLTTQDDFRLFLELHCQADCLITHGGYLRSLARGHLGNILKVGAHPLGADLVAWRSVQGLEAQPALVIASASLDFPCPDPWVAPGQKVLIATGYDADPFLVRSLELRGFEVIRAGIGKRVEGGALTAALGQRGYRSLYLIAGPLMLDSMMRCGRLSLLYQTMSHQLLGGEAFRSMVPGPIMHPFGRVQLERLHYDPDSGEGVGQWFSKFRTKDVANDQT